jgi:SAM-dependent methyltransferase
MSVEGAQTRYGTRYGLDSPGLVFALIGVGTLMVAGAVASEYFELSMLPSGTVLLAMVFPGVALLLSGSLMVFSSYFGKFVAREQLLDRLWLSGHETVADLGCGRGLLLIGAASRLTTGRAIGIDHWATETSAGQNSREAVLANVKREGVEGRVELVDGDLRRLPLKDASIDAVIAGMAVPTRTDVEGVIAEIDRVLRPGGRVALLDFRFTRAYVKALKARGFAQVRRTGLSFWNYPPSRVVFAQKPGRTA